MPTSYKLRLLHASALRTLVLRDIWFRTWVDDPRAVATLRR